MQDLTDFESGIGGGGFMLARTSGGDHTVIDFREEAPAAAFQDMYNKNTVSWIRVVFSTVH